GDDDDKLEMETALISFRKLRVYDHSIETKNYPERWIIKKFDDEAVEYNRKGYKYDVTRVGIMAGYNIDDGILIGGGPVIMNYGQFYESQQKILANFSIATRSSNFRYEGLFRFPAKNIELNLVADVKAPNYTQNYFGMGNETQWRVPKSEKDYYRLRIKQYHFRGGTQKQLFNKNNKLGLAVEYKNFEVENNEGRFISDLETNGLKESIFKNSKYATLCLVYDFNNIDDPEVPENSNLLPGQGQNLHVEYQYNVGLKNTPQNFSRLSADWSFYYTLPRMPRLAFALRAGGSKNFGEYRFYEAAKLGGKTNLRGFRATRFYGDAAVYQNTDIRFRLSKFSSYLLTGSYGILAFHDVGRVFYQNENSQSWHQGYGGGIWISPFNLATLTVSYAASRDDAMFQLGLNYLF
ncbi:MAG: BamA/TamA family outer membrane protein, partial [Mariniphaga sp.]